MNNTHVDDNHNRILDKFTNNPAQPLSKTSEGDVDELQLPINENFAQTQTFLPQQNGGISNSVKDSDGSEHYKLYKWRWYVLMVVSLLNCTNTLSWISYAPVANKVDEFYGSETANWLTIVYLITCVPVGIFGMWLVQKYGIRTSILLAAWLNGLGSVIRVLSSFEFVQPEQARFGLVIVGQCVAACAYPFIMCLPTKVSAAWFPDTSRTIANTIATMGNPFGVLLAMLISTNLVAVQSDVLYLNLFISSCCVTITVLATAGVRSSDPPTAPSKSAEEDSLPFCAGVKKLFTSRSYIILFISLGAGIGMFNALYGMMQQILCARGYSNQFAGYCCVSMIVGGCLGSFSSGFLADKTKKFEEIMKVAFSMAVICGIGFSLCSIRPNFGVLIIIFCVAFGFFGLAAYPLGLEMGVEVSSPVAESSSSGFIVLSGQIQGSVFIVGMKLLRSELTGEDVGLETCSEGDDRVKPYDMTIPLLVFCSMATLIVTVFTLTFRPTLKRMLKENGNKKDQNGENGQGTEMIDLKKPKIKVHRLRYAF